MARKSRFGEHLREFIRARYMPMRDLASESDTGISTISQTISGSFPPPRSRKILARWASALHLSDDDRERFFLLADISRSPVSVQDIIDVNGVMERVAEYNAAETQSMPFNFLGEKLAEYIENHGLDCCKVASAANISPARLTRIMGGMETPSAGLVKSMAESLGMSTIESIELSHLAAIAHAPPDGRQVFKKTLDFLLENNRQAEAARRELTGG